MKNKLHVVISCFLFLLFACTTDSEPEDDPIPPVDDELPIVLPDGFFSEVIASQLDGPTSIEFPPDGSNRLFVNELTTGHIWIFEDGERLEEPFFNLQDFYPDSFPFSGSRGLIGLEFHPDYQNNRWLYITYALPGEEGESGYVARITDENNRSADFTEILSDLPSEQGHQVQNVRFLPDGMLYLSVGDAYRPEMVQEVSAKHGKVLRFTESGDIPADNPFGGDNYVYALGFRNAFDLAFGDNGELLMSDNGDVGMDTFRQVEPGSNHGWPFAEGFHGNPDYSKPLYVWEDAVVPTGLHRYLGNQFPSQYHGALLQVLFGVVSDGPDPIGKRIQIVEKEGSGVNASVSFSDFAVFEFDGKANPIDIAEGPDGSLYVSDYFQGKIFRIFYRGN